MNYNILLVGFGVIGVEALSKIVKNYTRKKKLKILIIDKNLRNIPGGVAYSKYQSKFGFFNNPLRLSNPEFIKWIKNKKNFEKIKEFILQNKNFKLNKWLDKNKSFKNFQINKFDEIYLPRLTYSFFLEDKILDSLKIIKKKNIKLDLANGELINFENKNGYMIKIKKNYKFYKLKNDRNNLKIEKISKKILPLFTKNILIGNGLLPPQRIKEINAFKNNNYIWDFYSEGGTQNLLTKLNRQLKSNKAIKILFIGNKAGLLETMPEIKSLPIKILNRIQITSFSPNLFTLEKAELSKNYKNYKFKFLKKNNFYKINNSYKIYSLIKNEFNHAKKVGYNKYDVWTLILRKKILNKIYSSLNKNEKKKYNDKIFTKIRNITRYTYPETVKSKDVLEDNKILSYVKDKIIQINKMKKKLVVTTTRREKYTGDILVNVSGPVGLDKVSNEVPFLNFLKENSFEYNSRGFIADKNFSIGKNIYAPGVLSSNFNPNRVTIIKAITSNTHKSVKKLIKNLN
tara:strand:- start:3373 stop:4914 length:1542 start_codon:yes stop_codon:yes gene_type:complete